MTLIHQTKTIAIILVTLISGTVLAHDGAVGIVKERMDRFQKNQKNLRQIKSFLQDGNLSPIAPLASEIREWAKVMPEYFPEGSGGKPSGASPEIWAKPKEFQAAAFANFQAADALVLAVASSDSDSAKSAFRDVAASCKSCHMSFRER